MTLVAKNIHLASNRRMILGHAIASSAAGFLPVPVIDDWAQQTILRGAIMRIAESRGVDLDESAARAIADASLQEASWGHTIVRMARLTRVVRRAYRRALLVLTIHRRAEHASRAFAACTLFDHYCARLHVGPGIDGASAREVRAKIDLTLADLPRGVLPRLFERGIAASGKALARAPVEIAARIRRIGARRPEVVVAESSDQLGALRAIEAEITSIGHAYIDELIARFEQGFAT
jgi:hypothetical protein